MDAVSRFIDINKLIIDINNSFIDINKYGLNVKTAAHTSALEVRYQSLHESIYSVPDDRSTIRNSIYNKHQTCTAVCRQVVHESKSIIIRDIQFMHTLYRKIPP